MSVTIATGRSEQPEHNEARRAEPALREAALHQQPKQAIILGADYLFNGDVMRAIYYPR